MASQARGWADLGEKPGLEKIAQTEPCLFGENYIGGFVGPPSYEPDRDSKMFHPEIEEEERGPMLGFWEYPVGECYGIQAFAKTSKTMWALRPYLSRYAHLYNGFIFAYGSKTRISDFKRKLQEVEIKSYPSTEHFWFLQNYQPASGGTEIGRMRIAVRSEKFSDIENPPLDDNTRIQDSCGRTSRGIRLFDYWVE